MLNAATDPNNPFKLSDAERVMVAAINAGYYPGKGVLGDVNDEGLFAELKAYWDERLEGDLQAAIEVELATIPIYLYTYYSLKRTNQEGPNITAAQQYINQAGGTIMSVAVEEMLHMSLSSNIYFALTGRPPKLYEKAPGNYPTPLPQHSKDVPDGPNFGGGKSYEIPLAPFCFDQLWKFLLIEYTHHPTWGEVPDVEAAIEAVTLDPSAIEFFLGEAGWPADRNWHSIGQFYSYIRCVIASNFYSDDDFRDKSNQIQPYNYSPNNIDTIYPADKFTPSMLPSHEGGVPPKVSGAQVACYPNAPDSGSDVRGGRIEPEKVPTKDHGQQHELLTINSRMDVMAALETICEQGEGYSEPGGVERLWDDKTSHEELSHFDKFLMLQMQLEEFRAQWTDLCATPEQLPPWMSLEMEEQAIDLWLGGRYASFGRADLSDFIANYPINPEDDSYMGTEKTVNDFCSALFQYMLIMTETLYLIPDGTFDPSNPSGPGKPDIQNQKYFFNVALHRSMIWVMDKLIGAMRSGNEIPGLTSALAPSFSNIDLGDRATAYGKLLTYANAMRDVFTAASQSVPHYMNVAVPAPGEVNNAMQLPDVSTFWTGNEPSGAGTMASLYGTTNPTS